MSDFIATGLVALANVGAIGIMVSRTLDRIEKTDEKVGAQGLLLAKTAEVLEGLKHTADEHSKRLGMLDASRHNHGKLLAQVDALHELKGCKEPYYHG